MQEGLRFSIGVNPGGLGGRDPSEAQILDWGSQGPQGVLYGSYNIKILL